jgi:hypothetical protein
MLRKLFKARKGKGVIEFSSSQKCLDVFPHPVAAYKKMPDWYRKLKPTVPGSPLTQGGTAKRCIPVLDAVSQGYVIPLWADLHISVKKKVRLLAEDGSLLAEVHHIGDSSDLVGETISDLPDSPKVAEAIRDGDLSVAVSMPFDNIFDHPAIDGHAWEQVGDICDLKKFELGKTLLKFANPWSIKTPSGWSVAFKNPANNFSNDIHILEGVVDTDEYTPPVNFPFVWIGSREGEWVIPKGTPLVQVVPFQRTEVDLVVTVKDEALEQKKVQMLHTKHFDRYKTMFWHKRHKYDLNDIERQ